MSLDVQSRPAALDGDESDQGKGRDSDRRYQQSENVVTDGKCPEYGRGDGEKQDGEAQPINIVVEQYLPAFLITTGVDIG